MKREGPGGRGVRYLWKKRGWIGVYGVYGVSVQSNNKREDPGGGGCGTRAKRKKKIIEHVYRSLSSLMGIIVFLKVPKDDFEHLTFDAPSPPPFFFWKIRAGGGERIKRSGKKTFLCISRIWGFLEMEFKRGNGRRSGRGGGLKPPIGATREKLC